MKSKKAERTLEEKKKALKEALAKTGLADVELEKLDRGSDVETCDPASPPDRRRDL